MNKVILLGYLSRDPELRDITQKNLKLAKISIAVNDEYSYNKTYFFNCIAFGKNAEYICANLKKGDFVSIDGNLTNNSFINSDGRKIVYTEIVIQAIKNLGRRAKTNNESQTLAIDENMNTNEEMVNIDDLINSDTIKTNVDNVNDKTDDDLNQDDEIDWDDE